MKEKAIQILDNAIDKLSGQIGTKGEENKYFSGMLDMIYDLELIDDNKYEYLKTKITK